MSRPCSAAHESMRWRLPDAVFYDLMQLRCSFFWGGVICPVLILSDELSPSPRRNSALPRMNVEIATNKVLSLGYHFFVDPRRRNIGTGITFYFFLLGIVWGTVEVKTVVTCSTQSCNILWPYGTTHIYGTLAEMKLLELHHGNFRPWFWCVSRVAGPSWEIERYHRVWAVGGGIM